jgi:ABC-2 type transport system permease protein
MTDVHGFQLIMNFLMFPLFFLSGALYPVTELPYFVTVISYLDPLTYGVDALRGTLIGTSEFSLVTDFILLLVFSVSMVVLGAYLFEEVEVD